MKKLLTILMVLGMALAANAQQAKDYFTSMPDSLMPLLTPVNRADCIDFLESHMRAEVTNRFDGKSEMKQLTSDFIEMQLTPQSTWQMKVLPLGDAQVICAVSTVSAPAADSHLRFYDDGWQELPLSDGIAALPTMDDFFLPLPEEVNENRYLFYRSRADMLLMKAELSPDAQTLTFTFTTPETLDKETLDFLKPYIRDAIVYRWEEGRFVR